MSTRPLLPKRSSLNAVASLLGRPALIASLVVSALVVGARQLHIMQGLELNSFDQLVRLQPDRGADPRLLVVTVTEADIRALGRWPTSDQTLDRLFEKLEQYQPRVIGLDIYRDLPVEPGNAELASRLQVNDNIVAVCKAGGSSDNDQGVAPPPTVPANRLGFADIIVDADGIVRRNLLFLTPEQNSQCPATNSFSLQLALQYLNKEKIQPQKTAQDELQLGSTIFKPLEENTGGYRNIDARGYQILLNYRSPLNVAQQVTLTDVLKGQINPNWVKDRIVLIGVTATSGNDFLYTPYSRGQQQDLKMPGVLVHAQAVSQILGAVLDQRSLLWTWPGIIDLPWVWVWSLVGGILAWRIRHPVILIITAGATLVGLVGICYVILLRGGWVPLIPPTLGLIATSVSVVSYRGQRNPQQQRAAIVPTETEVTSTSSGSSHTTAQTNISEANPLLGGRYKVIEDIGSGGFGRTYLAEDTQRPGRPYCVVKQLVPTRTDEKFLQLARRLFNKEGETLEKLGRHDQIPQLLAYFEQDREFYLVQEFIKGHTLSEELIPGQRSSESQVLNILINVLQVLDFIHSYNVVHRDIKPGNIIRRDQDRRLVLIDFGAVKEVQTQIANEQESHTVAIGTSGYAPPEQLLGQPVLNSDIYALGIIAIQAVTGKPAIQLQKDAMTKEIVWQSDAQISHDLAAILEKMVRYDFHERYQSAAEVLQNCQHLLNL